MKVVVLLAVLVGTALAATPWKACDGVSGKVTVTDVDVAGCNAAPCQLKKGTNATVAISYTLTVAMDAVYNKVYGVIGGINVPFPGFPESMKSACNLGMSCPGKDGTSYTEKVILPVSSNDPSIKVVALWKLTSDADGKNVEGCFEVPLQVVS